MPKSREVEAWFKASDHPYKDAMLRVRKTILDTDPRMGECVKWKTPTFTYEGNLASFNPNTKKHVALMFHTGAKIPGRHKRLEGGGGTVKYMRFADLGDVSKARKDIEAVVKAWCDLKSGGATKKKTAKKKSKR